MSDVQIHTEREGKVIEFRKSWVIKSKGPNGSCKCPMTFSFVLFRLKSAKMIETPALTILQWKGSCNSKYHQLLF